MILSQKNVEITSKTIKLVLLLFAATHFSAPGWASITTVYVGQATAGSGDGSSCANQRPAAFFNSPANWGAGSGLIGPGSTVHLCGTITSALQPQGNGTASSPVTILWESGASLSVCNTTGAFQMAGLSYFILDLGGNTAAVTCPNNGTSLSTQINAIGFGTGGSSLTNTEIRNGTIGPLYKYSCCGSDGIGSEAIYLYGATHNHFHDLTMLDANAGIVLLLGNKISSSGNEIDHNTCASTVGRCIDYSNGDGGAVADTAGKIHDNDITFGDGWYSGAGNYTHIESIRSFNYGGSGSDSISGLLIFNNYLHGSTRGDSTSFIFLPNGLSCPSTNSSWSGSIFNNLFVLSNSSPSAPGDGFLLMQDCHHTVSIYNNTFDAGSNGHALQMKCVEFEGTNTVTMKNNICMNSNLEIYNASPGPTLTADYNDYYNVGTSGANGWYWAGTEYVTLASWQSATGNDSNSMTASPGLNADYTITVGAKAAGIGSNLTSLGVSQLDTSKPDAEGAGSEGTSGNSRLASGSWDLGAYAVGAGGSRPSPPSGLAALVQ